MTKSRVGIGVPSVAIIALFVAGCTAQSTSAVEKTPSPLTAPTATATPAKVTDLGAQRGAVGTTTRANGVLESYTVWPADNPISIATRFSISVAELYKLNPKLVPTVEVGGVQTHTLKVGQVLNLNPDNG